MKNIGNVTNHLKNKVISYGSNPNRETLIKLRKDAGDFGKW
jgi:hypothetical protein